MRITALDTVCLSRMHEPERQWITARYRTVKADCAVVRVYTEEGLVGIGEASGYAVPPRIAEWVDWLAPTLIGKDVTDPATPPHPNGRDIAHDSAVAGIDCALWDLRGRAAGKCVSELLGASPSDSVPMYASSGCRYDWRDRPEQLIEEALPIARELDRLGFAWLEEPIPWSDIDGYATLAAAVDMPVTGGESFTTLEQFRPYIEKRAYDIMQPDAGICGLTELVRIAEMAAHHGLKLYPHSWSNGLMAMAHAHVIAALPNLEILEVCQIQGPLQWSIAAEAPAVIGGQLHLPDRPGLGIELSADVAERYPYIEGHYSISIDRWARH